MHQLVEPSTEDLDGCIFTEANQYLASAVSQISSIFIENSGRLFTSRDTSINNCNRFRYATRSRTLFHLWLYMSRFAVVGCRCCCYCSYSCLDRRNIDFSTLNDHSDISILISGKRLFAVHYTVYIHGDK